MKHHVTWDGALKPHPLSRCALLRALIVGLVGGALSAGCLAAAAVYHFRRVRAHATRSCVHSTCLRVLAAPKPEPPRIKTLRNITSAHLATQTSLPTYGPRVYDCMSSERLESMLARLF